MVRKTFTVAMSVGNRIHSISNADPEVINRIFEIWQKANPNRKVHLFVNEFVD
jgi:hypothetical protein